MRRRSATDKPEDASFQTVEAQSVTAQLSRNDDLQQSAVPHARNPGGCGGTARYRRTRGQFRLSPPVATSQAVSLNEPPDAQLCRGLNRRARVQLSIVRCVRRRRRRQTLVWLAESPVTRDRAIQSGIPDSDASASVARQGGDAVIRHGGTILECLVAESSGHGLLDHDAISRC